MKKSLKATLVSALALFMLAGCAFSPATSAESLSSVSSSAGTVLTSALSDSTPDSSVSKRDASGEYDAAEAVTLSPDEELTITEEGVYILSGDYEGMIVIEAGEEDKVQLVLNNADLANENGPAIYVRSADKVFITAAEGTVNTISATMIPRWMQPCSARKISRSTAPARSRSTAATSTRSSPRTISLSQQKISP